MRSDKEFSRLQQYQHENKKLKREISSLRKQLARLDLDRHDYVKEIIEKAYQLEDAQEGQDILEKVQSEWKCRECHAGHLEIHLYTKPDGTWYYRRCTNCPHRTKSQKHHTSVRGPIKPQEPR